VSDDAETIVRTFGLLTSDTYEEAIELVDEDFEMVTTADVASEPDTYRGPAGVRRWWKSFLESMEWVRLEIQQTHPLDDGRVIIEFLIRTQGRASGIETDQRAVALVTARDGKVIGMAFFTSLEAAQDAAGSRPS
jgi:ketosteroid isomerase-like protein